MKRIEFLKNFSSLAALLMLPGKNDYAQEKKWLLQFYIRGFQYYQGGQLLPLMQAGARLELVREPHNPYDRNAVAVYYQGQKIGFVPAEKNEVISRLMDSGAFTLRSEILEVQAQANPWENVLAGIYFTPGDVLAAA